MFRFATDTRYSVMHFCLFVNVFFVIMVASTFGDSFLVIEDRGVWDTFVWTRPVAAQCLCDGPTSQHYVGERTERVQYNCIFVMMETFDYHTYLSTSIHVGWLVRV